MWTNGNLVWYQFGKTATGGRWRDDGSSRKFIYIEHKKIQKTTFFFFFTLSITRKGNLATTDVDLIFNTWNWFINNKILLGKLFCLNMECMMWEQSGYRALRFRLSRPTIQQCNNHGNAPGCIGWLVGRVAYDTFIPGLESRDSFVTNSKKWGNVVWQEVEIW